MSRPSVTRAPATSDDADTDAPSRPGPPVAAQHTGGRAVEPAHVEPAHVEPADIEPAHVEPADIDVDRAAAVLAGVARRTRVVRGTYLSGLTGVPVWLKCEHEQRTASFKVRGAFTRIALADPEVRARGVVAASAGNHAQGVAFAAARFDAPATIFVPAEANTIKIARTRRFGARVELVSGGVDDALLAAEAAAHDLGGLLVHPFDDPLVIAGQGTIGFELVEQLPGLRTVLVGIGGGGLIAGIATALRQRRADVRVVGVQAAGAPAFARSWRCGHRLQVPARTVADGMAVQSPGALTLALASNLVDDVVTVDEEAFWEAMVLLARVDGQMVEPAGAAGVAALLRHPGLAQGPTAIVLSGGNIDHVTASRVRALAAEALHTPAA
ncbi:threonine ammonia-lyase [Frankia sp. Cr2]|uniref:threonine ammonia-lyase n=1 Tax=Frankia sp. Cr2 TaxID=3073932 RepID=UPI002AD50539|nr:pyridoxal-phosphate dependent enzyme [Frankia sp. Cr2]